MTEGKDDAHRETHSSGDSEDPLNSPQDRVEADPALEPELARPDADEAQADNS